MLIWLLHRLPTLSAITWTLSLIHRSCQDCAHKFHIFPVNQGNLTIKETNGPFYSLLDDTKQCDEQLNDFLGGTNESETKGVQQIPACQEGQIEVDLSPHTIFPVGKNILPYVQLNFSIRGNFAQMRQLFFQFRCLYAPNTDDYLCHNHGIQREKWGRMIWPCRHLTLPEVDGNRTLESTFSFTYTCFRLFSLSQYQLQFYILPTNEDTNIPICWTTLLFTIPLERHLDPKIHQFYTGDQQSQMAKWAPLIFVDETPNDALNINLSPIDWIWPSQPVNLSIFVHQAEPEEVSANKTTEMRLVLHRRIFAERQNFSFGQSMEDKSKSKFRWRWTDIDSGRYTIYAFVDDGRCQLSCPSNGVSTGECKPCPHTALNLTVKESKYSDHYRRTKALAIVAKHMAGAVFVIFVLALLFLALTSLYMRYWRPRFIAQQRSQSVELTNRPNVLLLYTDDCQAHCDSVLALSQLLESSANARCFVDQVEFVANPTLRPSVWLTEKLAECDFVLTIFSECSPRVLAAARMHQRRHFPDHFNTAMGFLLAKINEIASTEQVLLPKQPLSKGTNCPASTTEIDGIQQQATITSQFVANGTPAYSGGAQSTSYPASKSRLNRFIFARFAYSPSECIPDFFTSTQFGGPLVLPQQIGPLIARLHGILDTQNQIGAENRFEHQADLGPLNIAVERFIQFLAENPSWMTERFETINKNGTKCGNREPLLAHVVQQKRVPTAAEQAALAERYGLLKADDEEEDVEAEERGLGHENDTGIPPSLTNGSKKQRYELVGRPEDFDTSSASSSNDR